MGCLLAFVGIGAEEVVARAFCGVSASLMNLTVISTHRHEGPQTASPVQGPFSSNKTWSKIHGHEWKNPFRVRPSDMTAPSAVQ